MSQLLRDQSLAWVPSWCELRYKPTDTVCLQPAVAVIEATRRGESISDRGPGHIALYICVEHANMCDNSKARKVSILTYFEEMN